MALSSLTVDLSMNLARFEGDAGRAVQIASASATRMARSQDAFIQSLKKQADEAGLTRTQLLQLRAAQLGVGDAAAQYIAKIDSASTTVATGAFAKGATEIRSASHEMEGLSFSSSAAKRELLVLGHELSTGNYSRFGSSLLVLGERTGAAALLFSGLGVAALATTAVIAAFGFAALKGAEQTAELNKALTVTGNFAGVTAGQFDAMVHEIAASTTTSFGSVRETLQGLVATGNIGPRVLAPTAAAIALLQRQTGATSEELVKDFAKMADGVAKWAEQHNEKFNFVTATQLEYIRTLEKTGNTEGAEIETLRLLSDHLSTTATFWDRLKTAAGNAWHEMVGNGRPETTETRLDDVAARIAKIRANIAARGNLPAFSSQPAGQGADSLDAALADQYGLREQQRLERRAAAAVASQAATEKARIAASDYIQKLRDEEKGTAAVTRETDNLKAKFAELAGTELAVPADEQARLLEQVRKRYAAPAGPKESGAFDSLVRSVQEKTAADQADLDGTEKLTDAQKLQAKVYADIDSGIVKATVSQQVYIDGLLQHLLGVEKLNIAKRAEIEWEKTATDENAKYLDGLEKMADKEEKAAKAAQIQLQQFGLTREQIEALTTARMREAAAALQQKAVVADSGYLTDLARLYNEQAAAITANADALDALAAKQAQQHDDPTIGASRAVKDYLTNIKHAGDATYSAVSTSLKGLEDLTVTALSGGDARNAAKAWVTGIIAEVERLYVVKPLMASIFGDSAGGSGGGWLGALGSIASAYFGGGSTELTTSQYSTSGFATGSNPNYGNEGGFHLASGTNFVPYDGMRATLHKGEAVVPAAYNPAAGSMVTPQRTGAWGSDGGNNVTVNVKNEAGDTVQASASKTSSGDIEVLVRKIVRDENGRDLSRGAGPISDGLKARGLKLDAGNPRRN